ncbi:hypothetical protein F4859DRAFT_471903 [Xylaria cf. heliscus]|nr:hypothetical protein F4859DRAFT_471903 [Xylaria cf. heliscus]
MKYTVAAALLPLLASAANIGARQATGLQYLISGFTGTCTDTTTCLYEISIITSNNPKFQISCDAPGDSTNGDLPAVSPIKCGTYTIAVSKPADGGLILTVSGSSGTGTHAISSDDLHTTTANGQSLQSYVGDSSFTIDIGSTSSGSSSGSTSVSGTSTAASTPTASSSSSSSSAASSSASSASSAASTPSTTGTTTSSSSTPSPSNGATRESAFAGVAFAAGLMAFLF